MKQKDGHMAVEVTHGGIPDGELKPEEFSREQLDVMARLDPATQDKIRRGYPIAIVDLTSGQSMAFNRHNIKPSKYQLDGFAQAILPAIRKAFENPETLKEYEKWKEERQGDSKIRRKGKKSP